MIYQYQIDYEFKHFFPKLKWKIWHKEMQNKTKKLKLFLFTASITVTGVAGSYITYCCQRTVDMSHIYAQII